MKIIAFYLPQFHAIPENDKWWGEGFTEWTNVKTAKSLFNGHYQPRIPLGKNYYNLLDPKVQEWQINLAKKYGIYGFAFYHYWFEGHKLLEKPLENFLANKKLNLPFCICWANETWTNIWASSESKTLIKQTYGDEKDWKDHFYYLLPFLKDSRYIRENNRPLIIIYRPEDISCLNEMIDLWQDLAKKEGIEDGLSFAYQHIGWDLTEDKDDSRFAFNIEYQPMYAHTEIIKPKNKISFLTPIINSIANIYSKLFNKNFYTISNYEEVWNKIIEKEPQNEKSIPGAFVDWDNSPRRGKVSSVIDFGANPQTFKKYLSIQIKRTKEVYHKDFLFMFAWNEWGESGYLEPDEKYKYQYLEAVKGALIENNEFPKK